MMSSLAKSVRRLQDKYGDALLTSLTVILLLPMFVVAPLRAEEVLVAQVIGVVLLLGLMVISLAISGNMISFGLMLVALAMNGAAVIRRADHQSTVLLYLLIAVVFAALFTFVGLFVANAFSGLSLVDSPALASNLIYFSLVTLTSTGFGDVVPVSPIARSLCNLETIIGQLYPATLLARLVTLELAHRR